MPTHDIIDNRSERLVDYIRTVLPASDRAKFAVGYFFISGLEALGHDLDTMQELRLLIGNTSNRQTIEQITEGYRRLELVEQVARGLRFAKKADREQRAQATAENLRETIEVMDQTDDGEGLITSLVRMIEEGRLKVRVYTRGRLHAKAYIFDYKNPNPGNEGIAIVGSSNLTLAGIRDNTELNVVVHDDGNPMKKGEGNHGKLTGWFEELWMEAQDFEPRLMDELQQSWAARPVSPYDVYMKTLYTLVQDRLEGGEEGEILWDDEITRDLADFQKVAVRQAIQMIRDNGGCFVSDVVGLGKSYVGAGIVKHFERTEHARPIIICPKPLEEMWIRYNEVYQLNAQIVPMSMLQTGERGVDLLEDFRYRDRDFVLVDESHNFRHHTNQRYEALQTFISTGRRVCLLTATPRNSRAWDVYNQIKLFHQEDTTYLPVDPPDIRQFFQGIEKGERQIQDILKHVLIRRTRKHILRWYGYADGTARPLREMSDVEVMPYLSGQKRAYILVGGKHQYFPRRELETLRYSIEDTYTGLYQELRSYLGKPGAGRTRPKPGKELTYARYGLWHYVQKDKQRMRPYSELQRAGINLRGLMRAMLFKRFESSVHAFRETLGRMIRTHRMFLNALDEGFVPAGEKAEVLLGRTAGMEEEDLLAALETVSGRYDLRDFDAKRLRTHIAADMDLLKHMLDLVAPITPAKDAKLQVFLKRLQASPIKGGKCLIFTQYADTALYVYENLNPGDRHKDIEIIYGTDKSKARVVGRFAPKANPEFRFQRGDTEIRLLVATDVLAEGLNMQDCDVVLNYDLHWNPVRLIQRFGRIDRIGSEHDVVWGLNFLPETGIERNLGIQAVLQNRIQEIHDTIGEDAAILDKTERLNEDAMYAIYEQKAAQQLSLFDEGEEEEFLDLNEAEELLRSLATDDPAEFERIVQLRDGIRSAKRSGAGRFYVFCQAGRYQQIFLVGEDGEILSRDMTRVLGIIKSGRHERAPEELPAGYNQVIMKVKDVFAEEVKHRSAQRDRSVSLWACQRYVLQHLRILFSQTDDEDLRGQINILEQAFRMTPTAAVKRELDRLRRNGVSGEALRATLTSIYHQHRLSERMEENSGVLERNEIPRIICSEALL